MNKNLTIIDSDSIAYMCGNADTLAESIIKVDERIENIIKNTNADYISLFISRGKYFRHDISSDYKANRTGTPPKWMRSLKSYLEDKYKANWMAKVEADDLVAYWMNFNVCLNTEGFIYDKNNEFQTIAWDVNLTMSAIDKDLIKSIPGKHYNFTFKPTEEAKAKKKADPEYKIMESEIIQGWFEETDQKYANNFIWLQMLMGDSSDGVVGIPRMGPKKAEKWMLEKPADVEVEMWVFTAYLGHFGVTLGIYEFQKNYRLLYMLKDNDDFMREIGSTPKFPSIIDVKELLIESDDSPKIGF
jgi:5'-3' exonuclease